MSRQFGTMIEEVSEKSGYSWDFLVDRYNDILEAEGSVDWNYFVGVSLEHDW